MFLAFWRRRGEQISFMGRIFLMFFRLGGGRAHRGKLMFSLVMRELSVSFWKTFPLTLGTGLLMGFLWALVWYQTLSNLGGSQTLINLLRTVQIQTISPFFLALIATVAYTGPMTAELTLFKSSREFETLVLMGIPPDRFLVWPRMTGPFFGFLLSLALFNVFTVFGAYAGAWFFVSYPATDFFLTFGQEIRELSFENLFLQCLLMVPAMSFFSLFNAWEAREGDSARVSAITRKAMIESFFFATIAGILITLLHA
ncbi:MAG: ABC transporter permease [Deltaproteobacteria bacterium]|nr:ABC transporter permease [Deltaproteobacteria bacterium]